MKKRIISLLLVLSMLLCVLPAASAAEAAEPKFSGYWLTLNESIAINFRLTGFDGTDFDRVVITAAGNEKEYALPASAGDGSYVFTFRELSPRDMQVPVTAKLYLTTSDEPVAEITKSVRNYCNAVLNDTNASGNLKTLVVDLLNYGAAFQTYKGDAGTLANAGLTAEQMALATGGIPTMENNKDVPAQDAFAVKFEGLTLALEDCVEIRYDANAAADGMTLKVFDGEAVLDTAEIAYNNITETYCAYFDGLDPTQMRKVVTAQIFDGEEAVSVKAAFSIESYANWAYSSNDAELAELVKNMMRYGDAAAAWNADKNGPVTPAVTTVEIDTGDSISVILPTVGGTLPVVAKAYAGTDEVEGQALTYSVSDTSVATVSADGTLTAVAAGATTLTVSCGGVSDTLSVYVPEQNTTTTYMNFDEQAFGSGWSRAGSGATGWGEGVYARSGYSFHIKGTSPATKAAVLSKSGLDLAGKTISFWMYDTNHIFEQCYFGFNEVTTNGNPPFTAPGLCIDGGASWPAGYKVFSTIDANKTITKTGVARTEGWHEIKYVVSEANAEGKVTCKIYIDGAFVADLPEFSEPTSFFIYCFQADLYFDDFVVVPSENN